MTSMSQCPRFDGCNAPRCPLDTHWAKRVHRPGEPICPYLLEAVKHGAIERFRGSRCETILGAAMEMASATALLGKATRYALRRAANSASRHDIGRALNAPRTTHVPQP
jgi:hypothetical protein